jgi:hypothetical protein
MVIAERSEAERESKDVPAAAAIQFCRLTSFTCTAWHSPGSRMNSARMNIRNLFMNISSHGLYRVKYHKLYPCATTCLSTPVYHPV